ncbi:cyclic nucleotide-binding and patatin-like phospholipase domain-containing protein [soil metagenome]
MEFDSVPQRHQDQLLARHLRAFLGDIDAPAMALLTEHLQWVEVAGGEVLMTQGEPGDSMYLSISGRLRAYVRDEDGSQRMVREMARGHSIGEMSLYTDEPRSATVVAIRDSVLVRLAKSEFRRLLASSAQVSIALTRQIIHRMQAPQPRSEMEPPVTIGLLPISANVAPLALAQSLATQLARIGRVRVLDSAAIDALLGQPGAANVDDHSGEFNRRIALLLDEIEAAHEFVLLVADDSPTPWTRRCSRQSDELLLLADASAEPVLHAIEEQCLMHRPARSEAAEILVLLHAADTRSPQGTRHWLARRPVADHIHIRPDLERDMARLARIQSRTGVGLVLAGGGARGLAHLGIYRALQERGIEIDCVGGTSIGSVMAAYVATDQPLPDVMKNARHAFGNNPTGDFNWVPMLSLIKGRRLRKILDGAVHDLLGFDADVEDLWKGCYCIATNYSQAQEQQFTSGPLVKAMLASISIPGALPPVIHEGDLLCDGGTFNNFPVDVMRNMRGIGKVIGVDLNARKSRRIEHDDVPGSWAVLRDRLRPASKRRYWMPSLAAYLMNVTILYSVSRQKQAKKLTDLYFNPPLQRVGMLAWKRFDAIVAQGYAHGVKVLEETSPEAMAALMGKGEVLRPVGSSGIPGAARTNLPSDRAEPFDVSGEHATKASTSSA